MKQLAKYFVFLAFLPLACFSAGQHACAKTVISDSAHTLTAEETELIRGYCDTVLERYETSVYIVTSKKIGKDDDYKKYMEQIGKAKDAPRNLLLLFVGLKKNSFVCQIDCYGLARTQMGEKRCSRAIRHMEKDWLNGNYYDALKTFCKDASTYMGQEQKFDFFLFHPIPQLFLSFLIGSLMIFWMARDLASKGNAAKEAKTYVDASHSQLLGSMDCFLYKSISLKKAGAKGSGKDAEDDSDTEEEKDAG